MTDPVTIVEQRGQAAYSKPEGPNYPKIVREVAEEFDIDPEDLRNNCIDRWVAELGG